MLCKEKKKKTGYFYIGDPHLDQANVIMDALKEWWKQLSFKDAYSWTDEEEEFASHGMSYPKAERLRVSPASRADMLRTSN